VTRPGWLQIEHDSETMVPWLRLSQGAKGGSSGCGRPPRALAGAPELCRPSGNPELNEALLPLLAERLYGPGVLRTSVSRLERFAACPFQFFVGSGLRAEERRRFEVDPRQTGSFQHEVLARFHSEVTNAGERWRDLTPTGARHRVARIAENLIEEFADGLFRGEARRRWIARAFVRSLQDFVEVMIEWLHRAYAFDPVVAEWSFGATESTLTGWDLDLGNGHRLVLQGKIDRVDIAPLEGGEEAFCVVIDYKSSAHKIDPSLLHHGIQLQLPTYLAALRALARRKPLFGVARLMPVGMFYANLRGGWQRQPNRTEAAADRQEARHEAYCHRGRFSLDGLRFLDRLWDQPTRSGQFRYAPGGKLNRTYHDPLPASEFVALLDHAEKAAQEIGRAVFAGTAHVAPFVKGASQTACQSCQYESVCRFDPWLHEYRRLLPPVPAAAG